MMTSLANSGHVRELDAGGRRLSTVVLMLADERI